MSTPNQTYISISSSSYTNCTLDPECEAKRVTATVLISVVGTLSLIGSLSILGTIVWFRLYKNLKHRMIMYLSFADILQSIGAISSYGWIEVAPNSTDPELWCLFQGLVWNIGDVGSSLWNANVCLYVSVYVLATAFVGTKNLPGKKFEIFSQLVWIFSLFLSVYGYSLETEDAPHFYGPVSIGDQCWITDDFPAERMSLHYIWMFVALGIMIILTTINLVYLCSRSFGAIDKKINGLIITLVGYPIIYAIIFMPMTIVRVCTGMNIEVPIDVFTTVLVIFSSNGIFNALYYGISRDLYQKWKREIAGKTMRGKKSTSKSTDSKSKGSKGQTVSRGSRG